jgi:hypothetical protein
MKARIDRADEQWRSGVGPCRAQNTPRASARDHGRACCVLSTLRTCTDMLVDAQLALQDFD